jgi:hypothetical protein
MINESVREWFRVHTEFLYTIICQRGLFYFDFWSLVHIWSGLVLFVLLLAFNIKRRWFWLIFLIIIYEVAEIAFIYFALQIFRPERINDQILDNVVGIFAAILCYSILLYKSNTKRVVYFPDWPFMLSSSLTFAFVWVGNYRYEYNYQTLNTSGINLWAFSLWLAGGLAFLTVYRSIKKSITRVFRRLSVSWLLYFISLLTIEYVGYYLLEIREVSVPQANAIFFGLIHGNLALWIYYLIFPFLIVLFYEVLLNQVARAQYNLAKRKFNYSAYEYRQQE